MYKIKKSIAGMLAASMLSIPYANAAAATEIQNQIDMVKKNQQQAHQIAEYVRHFGETDDNPAIQFAQDKWQEQQNLLTELHRKYEYAKAAETVKANGTYLGRFRISHYCPCRKCNGGYSGTATGAKLTPWHTIAVDPSVIKLNSKVRIDGYGTFQAQDTGGAIKGNRIDVCVSNHAEAMKLGITYKDVYVIS